MIIAGALHAMIVAFCTAYCYFDKKVYDLPRSLLQMLPLLMTAPAFVCWIFGFKYLLYSLYDFSLAFASLYITAKFDKRFESNDEMITKGNKE